MRARMSYLAVTVGGVLVGLSVARGAVNFSLSEYLEQVRSKNQAVTSSTLLSQGTQEFQNESSLLLAPTLVGDWHYIDDKKPPFSTFLQGDRTRTDAFSLGVKELTPFGLEGQLSYGMTHTKYFDVPTFSLPGIGSFSSLTDYWEGRTELTLSQSLWKNAFGRLTRANQTAAEAQNEATVHAENYKIKLELVQAESAYWRLALARETVAVSRSSVERAQKIRDWAVRRERLQLGDRSDRLQAEAALELRNLDLQSAEDEVRAASRAFNSARQVDSDEVAEQLAPPSVEAVLASNAPARAEMREDTLAAGAASRAAEARAEAELQTLLPDVQLYGTGAFNSKNADGGTASGDAFSSRLPTWLVGVKFAAPLDLPEIFRSRHGHALESQSAAVSYERKLFDQENEWKDLTRKLAESRRRLELSRLLELKQQEKLEYEKQRLAKGRTTTYQVLTFEQDYASAQLARIRAEQDVVSLIAQMKTFGGNS